MPFIGNQPSLSYTSFAKQDFTTSATTSYTLDNPVANENEIALFINFVRQEPTTAYTASGTSLTLTSATSASDDMYCVFLGKAVQTVNPPSGSVGTAQLADSAVSTAKIADSAVTSAKLSGITQGITEIDMWLMTSNLSLSASTETLITANLSRSTTTGFGKLGTGMTVSSGIWTFPLTGFYFIQANGQFEQGGSNNSDFNGMRIYVTTDNSSYSLVSVANVNAEANRYSNSNVNTIIDVTDTSNVKIQFKTLASNGSTLRGTSSYKYTGFNFIRLGDT